MRRHLPLFAALGVLIFVAPIFAHHAESAEYDATKPVKVTGTISKVEWLNPHSGFMST
jgi:hypothetical protein